MSYDINSRHRSEDDTDGNPLSKRTTDEEKELPAEHDQSNSIRGVSVKQTEERTGLETPSSPDRLTREQVLRNEKAAKLMRQMLSLGPSVAEHTPSKKHRSSDHKADTYAIESCDLYNSLDYVSADIVEDVETFQTIDHFSLPKSTSTISTGTFTISPAYKTIDSPKQTETSDLNAELKLNLPRDDTSVQSSSSPNTGHRYSSSRIRRRSMKYMLRRMMKNRSAVEPCSTSGEENVSASDCRRGDVRSPREYRFARRLEGIKSRGQLILEIQGAPNENGARRTSSEHGLTRGSRDVAVQIKNRVSKSTGEIERTRQDDERRYERCSQINRTCEGSAKTFDEILDMYLSNSRPNCTRKSNEDESIERGASVVQSSADRACYRYEEKSLDSVRSCRKTVDRIDTDEIRKCGDCNGDTHAGSAERSETGSLQMTMFSERSVGRVVAPERFEDRQGGDVDRISSGKTIPRSIGDTSPRHRVIHRRGKHVTVKCEASTPQNGPHNVRDSMDPVTKRIFPRKYDVSIPLVRPLNDFGRSADNDVEIVIERHSPDNVESGIVESAGRSRPLLSRASRNRHKRRSGLHEVPLKVNQSSCSLANLIVRPLRAVYPVLPDVECFLERLKATRNEFESAKNEYRKFADINTTSSGSTASVQFYDSELSGTSSQASGRDTFVSQARQIIDDTSTKGRADTIGREPAAGHDQKRPRTGRIAWFDYDVERNKEDVYDSLPNEDEPQTYKDPVESCWCPCPLSLCWRCLCVMFSDQRRYFQ